MIQPQLTLARPQGKVVVFQEMLSHLNSENHKEAKDSLHQTIPKEFHGDGGEEKDKRLPG